MSYSKEREEAIKYILVFDIETIKDTSFIENLSSKTLATEQEKLAEIDAYHANLGRDFPKAVFHKVACISFILLKIEYQQNKAFSSNLKENYKIIKLESYALNQENSEEDIIKKFWENCNKIKPRFISFNGRSFDMTVLKYRAMKYGISAEFYFCQGTKWENYHGRYACISFRDNLSYHFDILEAVTEFGSSEKVKLEELACMLDIPVKLGGDSGSEVQKMYNEGKIQDIINYCETDVIATYLVYLKFIVINGKLSKEELKAHFEDLQKFLLQYQEQNLTQIRIKEFLTRWKF